MTIAGEHAPALAVGRDAGDRGPVAVRAVVAGLAGHDVDALVLAARLPVAARDLHRGVDGVRAARAEEDLGVVDGGERRQPVGELQRGAVGDVGEARVRLELAHLLHRGPDDLLPPVARVGVPEARAPVEVAPPVLVVDPDALGAIDDELVPVHRRHVGERMPQPRAHGGDSLGLPPRTGGVLADGVRGCSAWCNAPIVRFET
jgi:hypothetical protein